MLVRIQSADRLAKALDAANSALTSKNDVNPIFSSMLLNAEEEELSITVVDTNSHQLRLVVPAEVNLPGALMLPGDYFTKVIARLGGNSLVIKEEDNALITQSTSSDVHRFSLTQGDTADFPAETSLPPIVGSVDGDALHESLKAIIKATTEAHQDIIFHGNEDTLHIYTSVWISCKSRFQVIELAQNFSFSVKKSSLSGGRLPAWSGPVNIHWEEGRAAFSQGNEHLLIKMQPTDVDIEGLDAIISMEPIGHFVVPTGLLKNRVHTIAIGKQRCILKVSGKAQKKLTILSETGGIGGSRMEIPVNGDVKGHICDVHLSVELLEKGLSTIDGDDVRVELVDYDGTGKSIALRISNDGNPEKRQTLILPLEDNYS